ncbi:UNVERIFIED_CONTAM: hypothetical protein Sradi_3700300 [Sesamum radiatum]|uniref:Mediator of RNA polymerase II transcription subunit 1 n=1 Tax=Sesamum radiatum TaxID=300843 RepID=A0AAW2PXK0_SESRA
MERTEPALVPEWLRCTGNLAGGGSSVQHTDVSISANSMRSRSSRSNNEKDSPRYLDRSSSSNSRRSSSSNGSAKHPYSSFSRSYRDKNRDREKEKSFSQDIWNNDSSDPLASILTSRVERSTMRRSQSLVSRKPGEPLPRAVEDSRISANSVLQGANNLSSIQKAEFEKDFPSLGNEEKQGATGIRRVLSPGLSSAVRNLPTGNSVFLGGEKWTSALAEVPATLANSGMGHTPFQQTSVTFSNSSSGVCTGLNMAEALSQPVARVRATTQLPDKSQRLEELAIKQSRQLIPMTPSMTKPLVPSSADKLKQPKIALKTNEDASSPTVDANGKVANGLAMALSTPASMSPSNSMVSALENKVASLSLGSKSTMDKRSSQSLAQSRSEFFNLMRRKTSPCATIIQSDSGAAVSSCSAETSGEKFEGDAAISPCVLENGNQMICNGDRHDIPDVGDICLSGNGSIYPDEEEAAFLRSLGWEENGGEDEGLTEEEINAFYQEYMNRRPSLEACRSSRLKCSTLSGPHKPISGFASPTSSSSESEPEV